jgi:hypothetical protein
MVERQITPAAVKAWLDAFDEKPDPLHVDITPSVMALVELGLPGIEAVLERLNAPATLTRARAQRVLEGALARHLGWVSNRGFPTPERAARARAIAEANGYDPDADESARLAAIARWREWLSEARGQERNSR